MELLAFEGGAGLEGVGVCFGFSVGVLSLRQGGGREMSCTFCVVCVAFLLLLVFLFSSVLRVNRSRAFLNNKQKVEEEDEEGKEA